MTGHFTLGRRSLRLTGSYRAVILLRQLDIAPGGDLASTGLVKLWLRVQVLGPGESLRENTTANTNLALAA